MPLYLVSSQAVVHSRIPAKTPEAAAEAFLEWRAKVGGELHVAGCYVLIDLAQPVKIADAGGKLRGEIRDGEQWCPARR